MSIASVTVFCNETFRIPKWKSYYELYKEEIAIHIIVDNNSTQDEYEELCKAFPNSVIIRLPHNGGITAAFNAGVSYVMDNNDIDAIAFIGNDIKIENGGLTSLYSFLFSDEKLGEVSPVLMKKDSMIIEDNGDRFDWHLSMNEYDAGKEYSSSIQNRISDGLPGGMNLAKKKMYDEIGLLNETLFMYSDEVDIGIRAKRGGYVFSSCASVKAWHQHENINSQRNRPPFSNYLIARNKVYLAGKYYGIMRKIYVFLYFFFYSLILYLSTIVHNKDKRIKYKWQLIGACKGMVNDMCHNQYSNPGGV